MRHSLSALLAIPLPVAGARVGFVSAEEEPPTPKAISIGSQGTLQPSALLQGWFFVHKKESETVNNQFRIRRTELKLKGDVIPKRFSFDVMIDPAQVLEKDKSQKITVSTKAVLKDAEGNDTSISASSDSSVLVQGEFIRGSDETGGKKTKPQGFYALAGYSMGEFQPIVRFGQLDPDTESGSKDDDGTQIEAGVNYYIPGLKTHEGKIQLAGGRFSRGAEPKKDDKKEIQVTTAFQVAF